MARKRKDAQFFKEYEKYLNYTDLKKGKGFYTSYNIRDSIDNNITQIAQIIQNEHSEVSSYIFDQFTGNLRGALIENEYCQMYEVMNYARRIYQENNIAIQDVCMSILYQTFYDGKNRYCISLPKDVKLKKEYKDSFEDWLYDAYRAKPSIEKKIQFRLNGVEIIRPYKIFCFNNKDVSTDYCKLFMEVFQPHKSKCNDNYIMPTRRYTLTT